MGNSGSVFCRLQERRCVLARNGPAASDKFFIELKPNFHEWDCVLQEDTSLDEWKMVLSSDNKILSSDKTVNSLNSLVELFKPSISSWSFRSNAGAGHMAALTYPQIINPIINNLLLKT